MQTDAYRLWSCRIVTFAISALAAASAAYWGLKAWSSPAPAASSLPASAWMPAGPKALALALGGGLATPAASGEGTVAAAPSRYALVGVVAARAHGGAALISIDGQEAKPVRVGAALEGGLVLESVTGRRAVLSSGGSGADKVTLELPPPDS